VTVAACRITLREWECRRPDSNSGPAGRCLEGADERRLAERLAQARLLEVTELRAGLMVRAFSHVGSVRLGEVEITVQTKLDRASLLNLLRYAYGFRRLRLLTEVAQRLDRSGFADLLVSQLLAEISELVARGLQRRYVPRSDWLSTPRGRIDLKRLAGKDVIDAALPCTHHPRIEDALINRVLLAGLGLAASVASDLALRRESRRLASLLGESVTPTRLDADVLSRTTRNLDRLTAVYEPALTLIRLLWDSQGVSLTGGDTSFGLPGFLFDMNRFFQTLVERYLSDNLTEHVVRSELRLKGMFAYVPGSNPRRRQPPTPRPDFVVSQGPKTVAILDAKYRDLWENPLPRDMLYQLAIYALGHEGGTATILYPTVHDQATEARIEVRDPVLGGRRALVVLRPVDLNRLVKLVSEKPTASVVRETKSFAVELVFGAVS
jgi:5-methylcytosine-specific restriction enzyme subunit McrC